MVNRSSGGTMRFRVALRVTAVLVMTLGVMVASAPLDASARASHGWQIVPSPQGTNSTLSSSLAGVSCLSPSFCVAVGTRQTPTNTMRTLVEEWNGTSWSVISSPNENTMQDALSAVSCVSSAACTAVGSFTGDSGRTLVESWDGSSWSIVPSPHPLSGFSALSDVSCTSTRFCVAVGQYESAAAQGDDHPLITMWNGSDWSLSATPRVQGALFGSDVSLAGVSCLSPTECTAVGSYEVNGSTPCCTLPVVMQWNGTAWSVSRSPKPLAGGFPALSAVSCTSASACMGVGVGDDAALAEVWNGSTWSMTPSTPPGYVRSVLNGVSCTSDSDCIAVGWGEVELGGQQQPLIENWNGTTWTPIASPDKGTNDQLGTVSCVTAGCTAVGSYSYGPAGDPLQDRPLVESDHPVP